MSQQRGYRAFDVRRIQPRIGDQRLDEGCRRTSHRLFFPPSGTMWQDQRMSGKRLLGNPRGRVRMGRRTISVPTVPSMTDADGPTLAGEPAGDSVRPPPIDPTTVQYLDRVRAVFRPVDREKLTPGLERFIGSEDIFRHVGTVDTACLEVQPMMQCPSHWLDGASWVRIRDLEILEILEDQDVRAG